MIYLVAAAVFAALLWLRKRGPRCAFVAEVVFTLAHASVVLSDWPWPVRLIALLLWPLQVRDLLRTLGPAGIVCKITRQHRPGPRMMVDAQGRPAGMVIGPRCSHRECQECLPDELLEEVRAGGLTIVGGTCLRCRRIL